MTENDLKSSGDRASAIAAYSHYLKLRENPEPQLVAQRDSVRAALASLNAETTC